MKAFFIMLLALNLNANVYFIKDMTCEVCVDFISFCANKVSKNYNVDLNSKTLKISDKTYDEKSLLKCLAKDGYEAILQK